MNSPVKYGRIELRPEIVVNRRFGPNVPYCYSDNGMNFTHRSKHHFLCFFIFVRTALFSCQGMRESSQVGAVPGPHGRLAVARGRARRGLQCYGSEGLRGRRTVGENPRDAEGYEYSGGEPVGEVRKAVFVSKHARVRAFVRSFVLAYVRACKSKAKRTKVEKPKLLLKSFSVSACACASEIRARIRERQRDRDREPDSRKEREKQSQDTERSSL